MAGKMLPAYASGLARWRTRAQRAESALADAIELLGLANAQIWALRVVNTGQDETEIEGRIVQFLDEQRAPAPTPGGEEQ